MTHHSTYKGATIYKDGKWWFAKLEDGMFTYSILEYKANTLARVKQQVREYYERVSNLYK